MVNVLVTGVGAIIGYGIIKSLNQNDYYIAGSDIFEDAVGQKWCNKFIQAVRTDSSNYLSWLRNVITENKIDIVFPGIEQDVHFISDNYEKLNDLPCKFVINNRNLIEITKDKYKTYLYLKDNFNDNVIESIDINSSNATFDTLSQKLGCPFLLKPRCGYASKGILKITTKKEFDFYNENKAAQYIAQPIISDNEHEYTVSVFADGNGNFGPRIAFKRKLSQEGATAKAQTYFDGNLDKLLKSLCKFIKPIGPCNFQFRKDGNTYKLLEINPRISSATSLRKAFGYNEAQMCVDFYLFNKEIKPVKIKKGCARRYIEDVIIYDSDNI